VLLADMDGLVATRATGLPWDNITSRRVECSRLDAASRPVAALMADEIDFYFPPAPLVEPKHT
jgi:hypothetical protein